MAVYRQLQISFWQDSFVFELTPEEKFFYIYLMTNSKTSQCGIYEISKGIIQMETGYNRDTVDKLISRFVNYGKILYSEDTKEMIILNWAKFNYILSRNTILCINKELKKVKNKVFVRKMYDCCIELEYPMADIFKDLLVDLELATPKLGEEKAEELEAVEAISQEISDPPYEEILDNFNSICTALPKLPELSPKDKDSISNAWNKYSSLDCFILLFHKAHDSEFLSGRNKRWLGCNFHWLIKEQNMEKVLQGNYDLTQEKEKNSQDQFSITL